ncbi:N-acetylmuramoyl-L-alanine amidase-like domain-containing protein [Coxiella-like endosymbiont]|uniref:N-acetylmuramoyl-L-alanine amidase-like domain-containing protein n=1 Tax=Coxiella-like endosymbiont TaxID=1592897 RepID=UPI00272C4258|nr:N-acetylmuramoyl-L-alanine amidase-like domain-containing protein [Coxiella-like endosymbiont]
MANIKLLKPISDFEARALLKKLKAFSSRVKLEKSRLPYLSLKKLLDDTRRDKLFKQIPNGSIIEIVHPNWNMRDKIGTNLNISDLEFALRSGKNLIFRHASLAKKCVVDEPLAQYLEGAYLFKPHTVKGIHVLRCCKQ